jgi:hypothetical protein
LQAPPFVALRLLLALFVGHAVDALDLGPEGVRPGLRTRGVRFVYKKYPQRGGRWA